MILGCGGTNSKPAPEWTKSRKLAGKEQKISHVSGIVVDDKFAYITMGGTIADQNEGMSGLRKIALDTGAVSVLDDGKSMPQSENGGIVLDEKYVYWNTEGKILRVSKDGGNPETIASEKIGIGIDMTVDNEKVYWTNHSYYSPNNPTKPSPIYMVSKQGGATEIFVDEQNIPGDPVADEKFVYWHTVNGIFKKDKSGGQMQTVFQATDKEGVDEMAQDTEYLYFGFRGDGESRWALRKISKNGGEPQIIVKTFSLSPFVIDDANIYYFEEDNSLKHALYKVSKNGGETVKIDSGYSGRTIAQNKTQIYFAALDDIYSSAK